MPKKLKNLVLLFILGIFVYSYLLPALVDQKQKEWEENGMGSVFDALDPNQDEQGQSDATHDEP